MILSDIVFLFFVCLSPGIYTERIGRKLLDCRLENINDVCIPLRNISDEFLGEAKSTE